ncbi:GntR family transcriptional regulator [Hypericibacter sp.]|uniref:GntR family transcriptional regulator n=1 Tax=Hypericibacter sp. TaxID=2705401 RepID=UPI003D6CE5CA
MSLYERTISFILQYIEEKKLEEGAKLPTEPELVAMAGVSMVTVRRALAELAAQGIVRREQGRGTFLNRSRVSAETTRLGGLRNGLSLDSSSSLETRLLGLVRRDASADESGRLAIAKGASIWEVSRLRLLNGRPMIHEVSVIPMILAPDLGAYFESDPKRSLYATLEAAYGLREVREEQSLVCRRPNSLDKKLLAQPKSDWVVQISGISYSARRIPIDSFRIVFDAKGFAFRLSTAPASTMAAVELAES